MNESPEVHEIGLQARRLATLDEAWASDLRSETAAAQGAWMCAADALREGSADDRTRARLVYWALREELDPTSAEDVARILHILRSGLARNEAFARLASRSAAARDKRLRLAALICIAQCQSFAGCFADAEARLREVLGEVRGSGTRLERTAYASLAVVYQNQGREFEALVLTRIVLRLSSAAVDPWEACVAHQQHCALLDALADWENIGDALDALEGALERAAPPWAWTVSRYIHGERAEAALAGGDLEGARRNVVAMRAVVPVGTDDVAVPEWHPVLAARLALAEGRPAAALENLTEELLGRDIGAHLECVRAHFALGDTEQAVQQGLGLLDRLAAEREVWGGAARRLRSAAALARAFEDHDVDAEHTHRAYDIAAEAAMRRIFELEHSLATLPDLAEVNADDMRALSSFRLRFRERHGRLLAGLAPYVRNSFEEGGPFAVTEGHLRVCAWCHRIASRAAQWLPVGHLLPMQAGVPVTHTICPDCVEAHGFAT